MECIARRQIGIILVVIGTVVLGFALTIKRQYTDALAHTVDEIKARDSSLHEPTEAHHSVAMVWTGLFLVAAGSLLQW